MIVSAKYLPVIFEVDVRTEAFLKAIMRIIPFKWTNI